MAGAVTAASTMIWSLPTPLSQVFGPSSGQLSTRIIRLCLPISGPGRPRAGGLGWPRSRLLDGVSFRAQACLRTRYDCRNDKAARRQRVNSNHWGGWDAPTLTEMPYLYVASVIG